MCSGELFSDLAVARGAFASTRRGAMALAARRRVPLINLTQHIQFHVFRRGVRGGEGRKAWAGWAAVRLIVRTD